MAPLTVCDVITYFEPTVSWQLCFICFGAPASLYKNNLITTPVPIFKQVSVCVDMSPLVCLSLSRLLYSVYNKPSSFKVILYHIWNMGVVFPTCQSGYKITVGIVMSIWDACHSWDRCGKLVTQRFQQNNSVSKHKSDIILYLLSRY